MENLESKQERGEGLNTMHIRSFMLYMERDIALNRKENIKMVHGDIFPYELRTGQGKLHGLRKCLDLGKRLLTNINIIAVQNSTTDPRLRYIGKALKSGEYIILYKYSHVLSSFLNDAHFNPSDTALFNDFIYSIAGNFMLGVYKFKERSYVFQCHKDNLENLVKLVFADSSFQPTRGFPLLLDYADIVCTKLISASDFRQQLQSKLARYKELEYDIDESVLRRR
jgi:hypothetical protein